MLKPNTCIAPFINLTVDPMHNTSPCPYLGGGSWKFDKENDLVSIWQSDQFETLRQAHVNGERHSLCKRCWTEEDVGKESARIRFLKDFSSKLKDIERKISTQDYLQGPSILTMKNGNVCNLQCRICGPKDSSTWIPEAQHHLKHFPEESKHTWFGIEAQKKNWSNSQMEAFKKFNSNLERVEHFGGEPFHNSKVLQHTRMLVELGYAKDIVLYFNTNGTHIPGAEYQELFKHFKLVEFNLSIDSINGMFEYIRHPAKWDKLLKTIEWCNQQSNFIWGIVTTVSTLNIWYLPEIIKTFDSWNKTNVFLNILENPTFYNIKNTPTKIKEVITKKLNHDSRFESTLAFMNSQECDEKQWDLFKFWTKQKDNYRNNSFEFTFPEFHSIINA